MGDLSLTPELRELLGEIADDPRANLLRVSPRQVLEQTFEQSPRVSSTASFLRKAERRLLEVHREEMGRLLYSYAHLARMQAPRAKIHVHYKDLSRPALTRTATDHRARSQLKSEMVDGELAELLRRCLATPGEVSPSHIMSALERVAPSSQARIALGLDLCLDGHNSRAESLLSAFVAEEPASHLASYAWENLGMVAAVSGRFSVASHHYESAVRADSARVAPAMAWLWFSLLRVSEDAAVEAAAFLDERVPEDHPALAWFRDSIDPALGIVVSRESKWLARRVAGRSSATARKVIHGFE